jgi:hypothetical protein
MKITVWLFIDKKTHLLCCNPSLELVTKVRAYKGASQIWSPGITFRALRSAGECEGMNP